MKKVKVLLLLVLVVSLVVLSLVSCNKEEEKEIDYATAVKLDMSSETAKIDVTGKVKLYIDGDTTHFYVEKSEKHPDGVFKARYLAVNTPESTGKIEEWGKTASDFTKSKLSSATSIILESDTSSWEADSTGSRYLTWVWYKGEADTEYRNLNIEILQEGLAIASSSSENRYGETCMAAIESATEKKLCVYSGKKDPNFFYGGAVPMTIKELRLNIADYVNTKVQFEGVVTKNYNDGIFVESFDAESGMYNGIYVYYGKTFTGEGRDMILPGNHLRIVGSVTEFQGTYQVSDIQYKPMRPSDPNNLVLLDEEKHDPAYVPTTAEQFNSKIKVEINDEMVEVEYGEYALSTSLEMKGLVVESTYTTNTETSSNGDITITCKVGDETVVVRTSDLTDENGELVKAEIFRGKTIDVKGIIDCYVNNDGEATYQIKLLSLADLTIH